MRIFKNHPLLSLVNGYLIDAPQPSNISYLWNFGSLLAFCLVIQIVTGVTLAMHYNPSVAEAFNSVEHIMRDVNNGWLIRYLHSNTASAFFLLVYLHVGRGLYYGSYKAPRTLVWIIGTIILVLMMATAFLGYVLPYGQMSLWGATVITNLMSAIPWVGQDIVEFLWGGFSVNNATLNRFFALHFVLPFILAALALMHLIALHDSAGSGNPLGMSGNYDRLPMPPYFLFKDIIIFIFFFSVFIFLLYFILKLLSCFCPILYCMDEITESRLILEERISKLKDSKAYWLEQSKEANCLFQESLLQPDAEQQSQALQVKKECERNLNSDSNLLRRFENKLASGDFNFNHSTIIGKRKFNE